MSRQEAGRTSASSDSEEAQGFLRIWHAIAGVAFSFGAVVIVIHLIACIVILVLSKDEKPHVPLRAFIIVQLCATGLCLIRLFLDYIYQRKFAKLVINEITSDTEPNDKSLQSFAKVQVVSGCVMAVLGCFMMAWYITGSVWVSKASSTRSDTPVLFWGSLSFLILAASGFGIIFIVSLLACCCLPCLMVCFN